MYRSRVKTPILLPPIHMQNKDTLSSITDKQTQVLTIMAAYIKGKQERDKIYDELELLKKSIT